MISKYISQFAEQKIVSSERGIVLFSIKNVESCTIHWLK